MTDFRKDTAIATVIAVVDDMIQDWGIDRAGTLAPGTQLAQDLEFTSVDIIQLCVALDQSYGRRVGFQDLLMQDGSYVGDLTLGQFADFINARLNGTGAIA